MTTYYQIESTDYATLPPSNIILQEAWKLLASPPCRSIRDLENRLESLESFELIRASCRIILQDGPSVYSHKINKEISFTVEYDGPGGEYTGILVGFWNGFPELLITSDTRDAINAQFEAEGNLNLNPENEEDLLGIPESWEEDGFYFLGGGAFCLCILVE